VSGESAIFSDNQRLRLQQLRILEWLSRQVAAETSEQADARTDPSTGIELPENWDAVQLALRQMLAWTGVTDPGQAGLRVGEVVNRADVQEANERLREAGRQRLARGVDVLLGISEVAAQSPSWLARMAAGPAGVEHLVEAGRNLVG